MRRHLGTKFLDPVGPLLQSFMPRFLHQGAKRGLSLVTVATFRDAQCRQLAGPTKIDAVPWSFRAKPITTCQNLSESKLPVLAE